MRVRVDFEITFGKKKGLRRLAGSSLTYEEAPPPQKGSAPPPLAEPKPRTQPPKEREKPLRLRANLSVREVARLLKDPRICKVVGDAEANFYERYASNNYPVSELAAYVGCSDEVGVRVYSERIENTIIREALSLKLIKRVEPVKPDPVSAGERLNDEDRAAQERVERREYFERAEDGECLHDDYGDESSA